MAALAAQRGEEGRTHTAARWDFTSLPWAATVQARPCPTHRHFAGTARTAALHASAPITTWALP